MKTRLIVSYGEASLLRGAGWKQAVSDGQPYYHEEIDRNALRTYRGSESPQDLADCEIAAPRLDELLVFLLARGWSIRVTERADRAYVTAVKPPLSREPSPFIRSNGSDLVVPFVAIVLKLLKQEAMTTTTPHH